MRLYQHTIRVQTKGIDDTSVTISSQDRDCAHDAKLAYLRRLSWPVNVNVTVSATDHVIDLLADGAVVYDGQYIAPPGMPF